MTRLWSRIGHLLASFHQEHRSTLDIRRKAEGTPNNVATDGERNEADGKDREQHSSHGKGPEDVKGLRCCLQVHATKEKWE